MTTEEFKQLENLLGKLGLFLGKRYGVIQNHVADGCHIALYNEKGEMVRQVQGATIEDVAFKLRVAEMA